MDEKLSEGKMIPRSYQIKMEKYAMESNTILFLPTGSGKTFVAIQIIKRLMRSVRPLYSEGSQRTFFLVNSVPLVNQQANMIGRQLDLVVKGYSSDKKVDFWEKEDWLNELEETNVIVMTAQILHDMLTHGYIALDRINLIIFDECHHAVDNHPMRNIMKRFEGVSQDRTPKILGLTATLLNKNIKEENVGEAVRDLERTFNSKICTVNALDEVMHFSTNPKELILYYDQSSDTHECAGKIKLIMANLRDFIKCVKVPIVSPQQPKHGVFLAPPIKLPKLIKCMTDSVERALDDLGLYGGSLAILVYIVQCEKLKLSVDFPSKLNLLQVAITHFNHARGIAEEYMNTCNSKAEQILRFSSPKVRQLCCLLTDYSPDAIESDKTLQVNYHKKELCGLIFVKEKFTCKVIYKILDHASQCIPGLEYLKPNFVVGTNVNPFEDIREEIYKKKQNDMVLEQFRANQINCLVATEVMEEGVDVPLCNLVLRFDPIVGFRSYVQAKGRGRSLSSVYVILVLKDEQAKFDKHYRLYKNIENMLNSMLMGSSHERQLPSASEQANKYKHSYPPYIYKTARVTMETSISLLCRYCQSLSHDKYTNLAPEFYLTSHADDKFKVVDIYLPSSCPIRGVIKGVPMTNIDDAKKVAALKACEALHKFNELNDHLVPIDRHSDQFEQPVEDMFFSHWFLGDEDENLSKAGTNRRKRLHFRKNPKCLSGPKAHSEKHVDVNYYINYINLIPHDESDDENFTILQNLLRSPQGYVLLTAHPLPKICPFTMYLSSGQVTVMIESEERPQSFTWDEVDEIKRFHMLIFMDVLEIMKMFMSYDTSHGDNYFWIAPTMDGHSISWETMRKYSQVETLEEPSMQQRQETCTDPEYYRYMVVAPWYRRDSNVPRYIVTKVLGTTPLHPFNDESHSSFASYYKTRYDLNLLGSADQPMLEVQYLSGKMNCLLPRSVTINSGVKTKRLRMSLEQQYNNYKCLHLVPEYCVRFSFPGILWLKATLLPSLLHRITQILVADELRCQINQSTGIGCVELPKGMEWNKLSSDPHAVNSSQLYETEGKKDLLESGDMKSMEDNDGDSVVDNNNDIIEDNNLTTLNTLRSEDTYRIAINRLSKQYPWNADMEPIDLERKFDIVNAADIECYCQFVNQKDPITTPTHSAAKPMKTGDILAEQIKSVRAICPPPFEQIERIEVLSKTTDNIGPQLCDIVEALTTAKSNDIINLERLETLGDSFLKFAASLYLVYKFKDYSEGKLTTLKSKIVSNRNLFYSGSSKEIPGRIKIECFSAKETWIPPSFCLNRQLQQLLIDSETSPASICFVRLSRDEILSGNIKPESCCVIKESMLSWEEVEYSAGSDVFVNRQEIPDKVVADCVEALIGVYLQYGGIDAAYKILTWFHILPKETTLDEIFKFKTPTAFSEGNESREKIDFLLDYSIDRIEGIIKYKFNDPCLLLEAMTHSSNSRNRITGSYERLEFLGDAILDFLITCHIYERGGRLSPGELTDLRSALVNNNTFACLIVRLGLHKYMQTSNALLDRAINKFVEMQENKGHIVDESVLFLLEEDDCQLAQYIEVPKALGDIFESLAGAIFLDCGGDLATVWRIFHGIMSNEIAMFMQKIPKNPSRLIFEQIHAQPIFLPSKTLKDGTFITPLKLCIEGRSRLVYGFGKSRIYAKRSASKIGLRLLGKTSS